MKDKLKYKIILEDGRVINTMNELKEFFISREEEINNSISSKNNIKSSERVVSSETSGCSGYGLDLI